jgi:hypothetical protein
MMQPPLQTATPDISSQGDRSGSGSRSGGATDTSRVPSRRLDSTGIVPTAWTESRYCDGSPSSSAWARSSRSLNRGKPIALQTSTASRSAARPNRTGATCPSSTGWLAMVTTAASIRGSDQSTPPSVSRSPGLSALNRTRTRAASATTWAAVSTAEAETR